MRSSILLAIFMCVCYASFSEASLDIHKCKKRSAAVIEKLEITGCTSFPCDLKKGTSPTIKATLKMRRKVRDLKLRIAGQINDREVPFSVDDSNHCASTVDSMKSQKRCLLKKGETYEYAYSLPVLKEYPSLMVVVKYEIVDNRGRTVACFSFPAKIVE